MFMNKAPGGLANLLFRDRLPCRRIGWPLAIQKLLGQALDHVSVGERMWCIAPVLVMPNAAKFDQPQDMKLSS